MKAAFYTLGCKVNQYEAQILAQQFADAGYEIVPPDAPADVYVVNSCTVTASGDQKTRRVLRRFRALCPGATVVLTGCYPQAFPDDAARLAEADVIAGARDRAALVELVRQARETRGRIVAVAPHERGEPFEPMRAAAFRERTRAFVKIEDGCDRYCAYCIIPQARGPVRSKPPGELRAELEGLARAGYREAVLVGINLPSYGRELGLRLIDAVELACAVGGIDRVRLGSLEPELLTDGDIARMARQPKLCPQFHLSLQSGCDATLARMRRHYDTAEYMRIVQSLRAHFENCAVTTDVMVGFPGETDAEFEQSLSFVESLGLAKAHVFAYSRRPGTHAADMPGQLPASVKEARSARMIEATDRTRAAFLAGQAGRTVGVLFETRDGGALDGYAENYTPVRVLTDEDLRGQIRRVLITSADGARCVGTLAPDARHDCMMEGNT